MSALDIREARGNIRVDLVGVVGPASSMILVNIYQHRRRIRQDKKPAHVLALPILLAAPDLANGLAIELRRVDVSDARERGEDARGLEGAHILAVHCPLLTRGDHHFAPRFGIHGVLDVMEFISIGVNVVLQTGSNAVLQTGSNAVLQTGSNAMHIIKRVRVGSSE